MRRRVLGAILGVAALVLLTGASKPVASVTPPLAVDAGALMSRSHARAKEGSTTSAGGGERAPCPRDMVLVDGQSCPDVEQRCLEWLPQPAGSPPRCAVFEPNPVCNGPTTRARFCIDRYEYPNRAGEIPVVQRTWEQAQTACRARGKRLCGSKEWTLACEGEARLPYPYGHVRDEQACNVDRPMEASPRAKAKGGKDALPDWRVASGEMNRCVSPFGVHDMTGNVDEWVVNESGRPHASGLKGGYWGPVRDRCRTMTVAHDEKFAYYQIGFRCCDEARR
jgi:sulfatase modifying factor 1